MFEDSLKIQQALDVPDASALRRCANSRLKRVMDFGLALTLVIFLLPVLLMVAVLIKLTSKGSVLFTQRRTGLNNEVFRIYKFRTMTVSDDGDTVVQVSSGDQRVTPIGHFLRRTSVDELPQLLNILKGDMSFVGPRPHARAHDIEFARLLPHYNDRFHARPGLTGLAQISGHRGELHTLTDLENRIEADLHYIHQWSIWMDIQIFAKTVPVILGDKNAY